MIGSPSVSAGFVRIGKPALGDLLSFCTSVPWSALYYYLKSGDTWYRRETNTAGGYFILWFSPDAGVTWEELLNLDITESDPVIDLTHQYRHRIVDDEYHVDQTLTATGYAGTEGVDWENLFVADGWSSYCTPTNLLVTAISGGQRLTWDDNCHTEDGYEIWISIDGAPYVLLDIVGADITTYDDLVSTGVLAYRVRAFKNYTYSEYSDPSTYIAYDIDLTTYIDGLITPLSSGQLTLLNNFIVGLKADMEITNLSDAFDCIYILAGETEESSLRNLVKRAHDGTKVGAPPFVALEGFTGGGVNNYIDTNYKPSTQAVRLAQDSMSFGIYSRTDRAFSSSKSHGVIGTTADMIILPLRALNAPRVVCNDKTSSSFTATGSLGFTSAFRSNASTKHGARNKSITNFTIASIALPDFNMYLLCRNNAEVGADSADDIQVSLGFMGRYLTPTEYGYLVDRFEAYMDANGKGVLV